MVVMATLKDLGYQFNDKGELRKIEDGSRFVFTNQEDYVRIGDAMTREVYGILENHCELKKLDIPVKIESGHGDSAEYCGFVYASPGFQQKSTVLLIIHGSGAVRPGQWSRRLILNESLETGSQIPYIQRALKDGWGVIVCSTNTDDEIQDYPCRHLCAVYDQLLKDSQTERFFVVAHSRGGPDFAQALAHIKHDDRFAAVCLTDSVDFHVPQSNSGGPVFINWKADSKFQQTALSINEILNMRSQIHHIYAGTTEHERSSHAAFNSIFHVLTNWHSAEHLPKLLAEAAGLTSTGFTETC
ncbi:UPF0528 protein [Trichostrongylus colubriformis]|uniref:UPF0528 protein n=1 Tax=Trichostrongylus colubriformis TaxID=6319 RepID=A0AAN8IK08_TRICO